jgi:hypothetical protein
LAVQENCIAAVHLKEDEVIIGKLLDHYYEINAWNWSATELSLLILTALLQEGHNNQG